MSERQLREQYLPGYQAGLAAGAKLVMTSFNTVDGIPATGNKWLFREILREEFGFNGVVISDWGAIQELIPHGVAKDKKQAAELAIKAGVDIEMMTTCYPEYLEELIDEGTISEELIDEAVLRILQLKNDLGLFENPYRGADEAKEKALVLSQTHREKAKEIARKSIVLLKNEAILPFRSQEKVAIVGPGADSQDILGAWSWQGQKQEAVSLITGAQALETNLLIGKEVFDYFDPTEQAVTEAIGLAKKADKVVIALGETDWMSGEAASRSDIRLPEKQLEFFEQLAEVNPNVVVTIYSGRPLDLNGISQAKAIVQAWMPGTEGGNALAEILWGYYNPSARLSMSFPETVGQVPVFYNSDSTGRPYDSAPNEKYVSKYLDVGNDPKYPFGFGLSYTQFAYSDLQVEQTWFDAQTPLKISVSVKNVGSMPGEETVQLYIRDLIGEVVRPVKELKDFKKIWLEPNEEKLVRFELTEAMVRYVHSDQKRRSEGGKFTIMVGGNSQDVLIVPAELNE